MWRCFCLLRCSHLSVFSSWELSGDRANYPVYTTNIITPLWNVTRWACSTYWSWGRRVWGCGSSFLCSLCVCESITGTMKCYSEDVLWAYRAGWYLIKHSKAPYKCCCSCRIKITEAFEKASVPGYLTRDKKNNAGLKLINLSLKGTRLITDAPRVWSSVIQPDYPNRVPRHTTSGGGDGWNVFFFSFFLSQPCIKLDFEERRRRRLLLNGGLES